MRTPREVPEELHGRPFHRREAISLGVTSRMLQHPRFVHLHPQVYRLADTTLDRRSHIEAAALALPADAKVSHMTRLELVGLSAGASELHFTIARELHLDLDGVMLHRTVKMPPRDRIGVSVSAAWVQSASMLKPIVVVALADRLIAAGRTDLVALAEVAAIDPWRPGAELVEALVGWVDPRSASFPESQVRIVLRAAGLPAPEVNALLWDEDDGSRVIGDLVLRRWKVVVEYEGRQHAFDDRQFAWDIERYRMVRERGWIYVRITARDLASPRRVAHLVHRALTERGYDGPTPSFGAEWDWIFRTPRLRIPAVAP